MEKKYELVKEDTIQWKGHTLYRIKALKDLSNSVNLFAIKKGELGGFVESEKNLSQDGECWIHDEAKVYDNATITDDVLVHDTAQVFGEAFICGSAEVCENAVVKDTVEISDCVTIEGNSEIFGGAVIMDKAVIMDNAKVCGNATVNGNSLVYGDAIISENQVVNNCHCTCDLSKNLSESIRCQTGLLTLNKKVIACTKENKEIAFKFSLGEEINILDLDYGFSAVNEVYGTLSEDDVLLIVEIDLEDIVQVSHGEIICKKAKVLGIKSI